MVPPLSSPMLTPFRLGVGGVVGDGSQWMSWIALDDVVGAIQHALATDSLRGSRPKLCRAVSLPPSS